jgi:DNA-binding MarR family transcriptional regulator
MNSLLQIEEDFTLAQRAMNRARAALAERLTATGLTCEQWTILKNSIEPIQVGVLAANTGMHRPSVSRILAVLSQEKLIKRTLNKDDSRIAYVTATAKGRRLLSKVA